MAGESYEAWLEIQMQEKVDQAVQNIHELHRFASGLNHKAGLQQSLERAISELKEAYKQTILDYVLDGRLSQREQEKLRSYDLS